MKRGGREEGKGRGRKRKGRGREREGKGKEGKEERKKKGKGRGGERRGVLAKGGWKMGALGETWNTPSIHLQ